jgi:hypothetical protein
MPEEPGREHLVETRLGATRARRSDSARKTCARFMRFGPASAMDSTFIGRAGSLIEIGVFEVENT